MRTGIICSPGRYILKLIWAEGLLQKVTVQVIGAARAECLMLWERKIVAVGRILVSFVGKLISLDFHSHLQEVLQSPVMEHNMKLSTLLELTINCTSRSEHHLWKDKKLEAEVVRYGRRSRRRSHLLQGVDQRRQLHASCSRAGGREGTSHECPRSSSSRGYKYSED